jgi:hypothetical protein
MRYEAVDRYSTQLGDGAQEVLVAEAMTPGEWVREARRLLDAYARAFTEHFEKWPTSEASQAAWSRARERLEVHIKSSPAGSPAVMQFETKKPAAPVARRPRSSSISGMRASW